MLATLIVGAIINMGLGVLVLRRGRPGYNSVAFFALTLALVAWSGANYISLVATDLGSVLFWMRVVMALAVLQGASFYLFAVTFPDNKLTLVRWFLPLYGLAVLAVFILAMSSALFSGVVIDQITGARSPQVEKGMLIFLLVTVGSILAGLVTIIKKYLGGNGYLRSQIAFLFLGIFAMFFLMITFNLLFVVLLKNDTFVFLGPLFTLPFILATTYAIVAHQLFDIKVIIKRTIVYSGLLLFAVTAYSMVVFFFTTLLGNQPVFTAEVFLTNLAAAVIIAVGFEPLRQWLVRTTDKFLFVGDYDPQTVLSQLTQSITGVLDLDEALQSMMKVLAKALRVKQLATFILQTDKTEGLKVKRVQSVGYDADALVLPKDSLMLKYFAKEGRNILNIEQMRDATAHHNNLSEIDEQMLKQVSDLDAAVILPIKIKERLIGVLAVGAKLSGDIFNADDLQFLDVVAKQTAAAIEKSRFYEDDQLKSEFVSIASHELLTPTAAIEGYLSMILDEKMGKVDPKAEDYLRKVQSSARRLAELVTDLLSVSRIEGGRIVINKQPIDVSQLIEKVIGEIKVKADQSAIILKYLAPTNELGKVKTMPKALADPDRVTQVVTNLISNAIKYNRAKGSIEVSLQADKKFVTIAVKDTGIGISPQNIPHLFEKFYRVSDDSAAAEKVGTGLGLYITKSIVELQGGTITLDSVIGKGSEFRVTLPVA